MYTKASSAGGFIGDPNDNGNTPLGGFGLLKIYRQGLSYEGPFLSVTYHSTLKSTNEAGFQIYMHISRHIRILGSKRITANRLFIVGT